MPQIPTDLGDNKKSPRYIIKEGIGYADICIISTNVIDCVIKDSTNTLYYCRIGYRTDITGISCTPCDVSCR